MPPAVEITRVSAPGWQEVVRLEAPSCGMVAFVAIHAGFQGRSFGGIRIHRYPNEHAALTDAKALAWAMSHKLAFAELPGGGAKAVILDHPDLQRQAAVRCLGDYVESLAGAWGCGPDLGFTTTDLATLQDVTRFVACQGLDAAAAAGVVASMEGLMDASNGRLADCHVAVQGAGAVGGAVVQLLRDRGARVTVADIDPSRSDCAPESIYDLEADLLCPCALGSVLNADTIPRLAVSAVCGAANNQLAEDSDAQRLHRRKILLVPDFVANAGAAILGVLQMLGQPAAHIEARLDAMRPQVEELVRLARQQNRPPRDLALDLARQRLQRRGSESEAQ